MGKNLGKKEREKKRFEDKLRSPAEERFAGYDIHYLDAKTKLQNPSG